MKQKIYFRTLVICFFIVNGIGGQVKFDSVSYESGEKVVFSNKEDSTHIRSKKLYIYKTEEDFFKGKKTYLGLVTHREDGAAYYKYVKTGEKKKQKVCFMDSSVRYSAYEIGRDRYVNMYYTFYYLFAGGTKDVFLGLQGEYPSYDKEGYINGITIKSPGLTFILVDRKRGFVKGNNMLEFLAPFPYLLQQYKKETEESDNKKDGITEWRNRRLEIVVKYTKLYIKAAKY